MGVNWNGSVGGSLGGTSWQPQVGGGQYDRSGVSGPAPVPDPQLEQAAQQRPQGPQYFGFHNDSSILARLAQQGVAPNAVNLRIAQQMLRYGLPLNSDTIAQIRQIWQALGASSLVDLEAIIALFSSGLPTNPVSLQAMLQLLSGGPTSHLIARLTMALKQSGPGIGQLDALKVLLSNYWKLGNGPEALPKEIGQFQQLTNQLRAMVDAQAGALDKLPQEIAAELMALRQLFQAQSMLQRVPGRSIYVPFFQWRDQQPMPGEFLVETERDPIQKAAQYTHLTVSVDTRNLGRMTLDFTALRGHLAVRFEVQDAPVKKVVESQLGNLQRRLAPATGYAIAGLKVTEVGQGRSISVLLPKRRDVRKLSRAIGII